MSFSQQQKADITSQVIKSTCCKRALLEGVFCARADVCGDVIEFPLDGSENIEYIGELIYEVYSKDALVRTSSKGGRRKLLSFKSKAVEKYMESVLILGVNFTSKCPMCQSAFLRGIFLACGRVSDPEKQYSLEFSLGNRAEMFCDFFKALGLEPKVAVKTSETLVYFRNSTYLEDFFALAGMNQAAFHVMNAKIQGDLRNAANRVVNCETNNIERAISASMSQISLIEALMDNGLISLLPEELEATARFRMENKDMSLSQMAGAITPSISKSGLSHRLKRISELAEEILKNKENKK